jgi:hypothetical protein
MGETVSIPKSLANKLYERHVERQGGASPSFGGASPSFGGASPSAAGGKRSKYGNIRTEVNGLKFDSKKEAKRYSELIILEKTVLIRDLICQPAYPLIVGGEQVAKYVADFRYMVEGRVVIEDVKSESTAKNAVYRLKNKMFHACYRGLSITEV